MNKLLRIVCLIAVLLPLALSTPSAAQDSFIDERERQIEEKKREIDARQREQDALKRQALFAIEALNVTNAQIEEVDAALAEVNNWIAAAVTRLRAVELSQTAAQERVSAARERDLELDEKIAAIQERLRAQVVDIYLDLVYEQNFLLQDGDPNRNARRQYYIEELGADAQVLIDRLRQTKDDQQIAVQQAEQAQAEIERAQAEIEEALADLAELRSAQKKLQDEWNRKRQELEERIAAEAQASLDIENQIAGLDQDILQIEDEIEREKERRRLAELERQRQAELARLAELDPAVFEAASDLGASGLRLFRRVTLPLLVPGIVSGGLLAFIISLDDYLISAFVAGPTSTTLPIFLFGLIRRGASPLINAVSTLLLAVTVVVLAASYLTGRWRRGR